MKAIDIVTMQHALNVKTIGCSDWWKLKRDWPLAAWKEAAEILDHYPWKWWKKGEPTNEPQVLLELVDIFHFAVSQTIQDFNGDLEQAASVVASILPGGNWTKHTPRNTYSPSEAISGFVSDVIISRDVSAHDVANLTVNLGFEMRQVLDLYSAKQALNRFRQDNGYADGTYQKIWADGSEDNVHLADIVMNSDQYTSIYDALAKRYNAGSSPA